MLEINEHNFFGEVLNADRPVLVDVWAPWCPPCKLLTPLLKLIETEIPEVKFVSLDYDQNERLAQYYGVMSLPTMLMFKPDIGKADEMIGLKSRIVLTEWIKSNTDNTND